MICLSCGQRNARRECPALGRSICAICCGTKRLVEIDCPSHCRHLVSSREHPAAVVRRRQEQDVERLLPTIRHLTERQSQIFFLFHSVLARYKPGGLARLLDRDVAEAAAAVAATLETAARGVIYEHAPQSPPAQALAVELKTTLAQMREEGATVYDHEAAVVLRAIETGARPRPQTAEADAGQTAYLDMIARLLRLSEPSRSDTQSAPANRLIVP